WDGGQFDTNFVSGANARITFMHIDFNPVIKVNNAVRLYGHYRLNSWNNPLSSFYVTENAPGLHNAFTEGQWDLFWLAANTPWGVFGLGKRPWSFGIGLQYDGEDSLTTESLTLSAPYGPFNIGLAFYPYRYAGHSKYPPFYQPYGVQPIGDPFDLPMGSNYYSRSDESGSLINDFLFYATYFNGPMKRERWARMGAFTLGLRANSLNMV
ncbi:MAG: hypothetical protein ACP5VS_04810, partial [Desulfomonilaceae bacterium]